jgi:flagellar hook-basal body complex protein FliE
MRIDGPASGAPGVLPLAPTGAASAPTPATETGGVDFASELGRALSQAGGAERASEEAAAKFAAGDPSVGLHEVMIASEKASIGVRYAVTLQKRLIDAYRELMQTNI